MGERIFNIDLGAQQLLAAEKAEQKIAVEIKSFSSKSAVAALENAVGQFIVYHDILREREPGRMLFLAVPETAYRDLFEEPIGKILLKNRMVRLLVYATDSETIVRWKPRPPNKAKRPKRG